jgi:putative glycosyltransferase (TIGR04372 family)
MKLEVLVLTDPKRLRVPRWRRPLYDLRRAVPRERLRMAVRFIRKALAECALLGIRAALFNALLRRLWLRLLRGRVEFFGNSHSIGDMAVDVDYYLLQRLERGSRAIGIHLANKPHLANRYFAELQARALGSPRVRFLLSRWLCRLLEPLERPLFFAGPAHSFSYSPPEYNDLCRRHNLHLERHVSSSDRRLARELMAQLGLPRDAKFVTVHVREAGFKRHFHRTGHNTFRDADIAMYVPALASLAQQGFWVVRMGEATVKPLPPMDRVIDYARSALKSDVLDVVLMAECEFLIATPSGLMLVAHVFNKPILCTNTISLRSIPYAGSSCWIPKRLFSQAEGRFVPLAEAVGRGWGAFQRTHDYVEAGLEVRDNSPEELLEAVQEMAAWHDGRLVTSGEDARIQQAVTQLLPPHYESHGNRARLCASFIRRHLELMPQAPVMELTGAGAMERERS